MVEVATLAGGCFWCLEAVYEQTKGVVSVECGYMGGTLPNPTYEEVSTGRTGHAEVVRIVFEPSVIPFRKLLEIFFAIHDPTTLNRQGNDIGTQYRSAIFYHSPEQEEAAREAIAALSRNQVFANPIVTEVVPAGPFYRAEEYHQKYFARHPLQGYCTAVIAPKVAKFRRQFAAWLKE
jgi:peptide-methionine (S)-S-oxide reductase